MVGCQLSAIALDAFLHLFVDLAQRHTAWERWIPDEST
jgi:hypothetical protein